jgi:hypothetical protein
VTRIWLARLGIAIVFFANVQCAIAFIVRPESFSTSYELDGVVGEATLRAIGVLFLMWNVPYAVALWHPARHRLSLWEAVVMQSIGVVGESFLVVNLPAGHPVLHIALERFIWFDGLGFILLGIAVWLSYPRTTGSR